MEKFQKLSRAEMKNVTGGHFAPVNCTIGAVCNGVENDIFISGTCDASCACSVSNDGQSNSCSLS